MLTVLNNLIDIKRNMASMSINNNPTTLTINRSVVSINSSTGGKSIVDDTFNITCRVTKVNNSNRLANEFIGVQSIYNGAVILADYNAPFMSDMEKYIYTFDYDNQKYSVKSVMINREKTEITSIQVICEVV